MLKQLWEKLQVNSGDPLWVTNLFEIPVLTSVSSK